MPVGDEDVDGVHVRELPDYLTGAQSQTVTFCLIIRQNLTLSDALIEVHSFTLTRHYVNHVIGINSDE